MDDWIEFSVINIENIDEIIKCFGLDETSCNEKKCCSFSNSTGNCKLLLPKNNMISENNNEDFYFLRVSDEMVRYKKFKCQKYLCNLWRR